MIYIETPRLLLRGWSEHDLEPFRQLNADETVMRYFPKTLTHEETDQFYNVIQAEFKESGYGLYAVEIKETKAFIGLIGFHKAVFEADFTPCVEIGWRLKKEAWGQGYAPEGAAACLQYGFQELGFDEIYSFTADINKPSQRVMAKVGMHYVKSFNHPKVDTASPLYPHVLYHVKKESRTDLN
ncbi:GNAT family N-acetyltransferase [Paenibacillus sp. 1001270B_150601_E10]|uniref:GNAT family N-acetyltransferase n=1 Tax=Paenibacillus sp. 1001270B_150601_E10 TaxID=2787079 RepID=UPI0018A067DA|nr:GNAT family N-acetyltransferase [Paenibacillus sp. 1001270B_150601_E10]